MEFRWRADDGPLCSIWILSLPSSTKTACYIKKTLSESKLSGSASAAFHIILTSAERVYVIVM